MSQHQRETDAAVGARLRWALGRYRTLLTLVATLTLTATGVAVALTLVAPQEYTATSSVVARDLVHDPAGLPRLAEAVGDEEEVLQDAIDSADLPYDTDEIREHVKLEPLEANVLVLVESTDTDPAIAVRASNAVAESLADSLNDAGPGVGVFSLLNEATTAKPVSKFIPVLIMVVGGVLATLAAVLAVTGLALALRRPLTGPDTAAMLAGRDMLAVIDLGEVLSEQRSTAFIGLASVLAERSVDRVVVTGARESPHARHIVALGIAKALNPITGAGFVPAVGQEQAMEQELDGTGVPLVDRERVGEHHGSVVVEGVADEFGSSTVALPPGTKAVVLAVESHSETDLLATLNRMPYSQVAGLVFLKARKRQERLATVAG